MKGHWRSALGFLLSAALIFFIVRRVDLVAVWAALRAANAWLLILSAVVATCIFPLRARRWRTILDPIAPGLPFPLLWRATAAGFAINNLVGGRVGEIARAFAISRETPRISFSAGFASLAVDRLFDAMVLLLLLLIGVAGLPAVQGADMGGRSLANWVMGGIAIVVVMIIAMYIVVLFPAMVIRIYEAFARKVAPRFEAQGRDLLISLTSGLSVLKSPTRFAAVFLWAVAHWLVHALAFWIGFRAFGIDGSFQMALFAQGVVAMGVSIPQAPGGIGGFQLAGIFALELFGVAQADATAWAFGYWICAFIPISLIGMYYFIHMGLNLQQLRRVSDTKVAA